MTSVQPPLTEARILREAEREVQIREKGFCTIRKLWFYPFNEGAYAIAGKSADKTGFGVPTY